MDNVQQCVCSRFDDGSSFSLSSYAGGGNKDGLFSSVSCEHVDAVGQVKIYKYKLASITTFTESGDTHVITEEKVG